MGMSRSRLKRDRAKGLSTDKRMSRTIKHLKHSIAKKDERIKKLEACLNDFNWLYDQYDAYRKYAEDLHEISCKVLGEMETNTTKIKDVFAMISMEATNSLKLAKMVSDYSTKNVNEILKEKRDLNIKKEDKNE